MYRQPLRRSECEKSAGPRRHTWLYPLLLTLSATPVVAQQPADPIEVCSQVADTSARLDCFDQLAARRRAGNHGTNATPPAPALAPAPSSPAVAPNPALAAAKPSEDTTGLDPEQIRKKHRKEGLPVEETKTVVSTVARLDARPSRHCYFELDNGQVWASTDAGAAPFVRPHEPVSIRPGVFGAFFLKTGNGSTMRVYRLR